MLIALQKTSQKSIIIKQISRRKIYHKSRNNQPQNEPNTCNNKHKHYANYTKSNAPLTTLPDFI